MQPDITMLNHLIALIVEFCAMLARFETLSIPTSFMRSTIEFIQSFFGILLAAIPQEWAAISKGLQGAGRRSAGLPAQVGTGCHEVGSRCSGCSDCRHAANVG